MSLRDTSINSQRMEVCKFGRIVSSLDDDDLSVLTSWINDRGFGAPKIRAGLNEAGFPIGQDTVGRHLVGNCCCSSTEPFYGVRL
jgi:hypothetical protein